MSFTLRASHLANIVNDGGRLSDVDALSSCEQWQLAKWCLGLERCPVVFRVASALTSNPWEAGKLSNKSRAETFGHEWKVAQAEWFRRGHCLGALRGLLLDHDDGGSALWALEGGRCGLGR